MKSNIEIAYEFVKERNTKVPFKEIWDKIKEVTNMDAETEARELGRFYTNLSLDGRFVTVGENEWDLRSHKKFEEVHIDMNDVYKDVEEIDEADLDQEELDYEKQISGDDVDSLENDEESDEDKESEEEDY